MATIEETLHSALAAHKRGDHKAAEEGYVDVLRRVPGNANAAYLLGVLSLQAGRAERAEQLLGSVAERAAAPPEVLYHLGLALQMSDKYPQAIAAFSRMFRADPLFQERSAQAYVASFSPVNRSLYWSAPAGLFEAGSDTETVFETIYERQVWGGGSGAGSHPKYTCLYAAYVQHLIERLPVRSILDIGCGDWQLTRLLDFGNRTYLGLDVVSSVVERNNQAFGSATVRFEQADATTLAVFPEHDLLLCKDVLQHLSNRQVSAFLRVIRPAASALITNDYHPANDDCAIGSTRPLDVTAPPFSLAARPVLAFLGKVSFLHSPGEAKPA